MGSGDLIIAGLTRYEKPFVGYVITAEDPSKESRRLAAADSSVQIADQSRGRYGLSHNGFYADATGAAGRLSINTEQQITGILNKIALPGRFVAVYGDASRQGVGDGDIKLVDRTGNVKVRHYKHFEIAPHEVYDIEGENAEELVNSLFEIFPKTISASVMICDGLNGEELAWRSAIKNIP